MSNYLLPVSLADALDALASGDWQIVAGGTDFYPARVDRPIRGNTLDISRIDELRGIRADNDYWHIAACTTWTDVIQANLPGVFAGLKLAAREVGSMQIQNVATVAGNLCNASPAADSIPPLLTLNAELELSSVKGQRTLPLAEFITGVRTTAKRPDELLTGLRIPRATDAAHSHFVKLGARVYLVISIAMVAAILQRDSSGNIATARIAVGSCSPVACRLPDLELALQGQAWHADSIHNTVAQHYLTPLSPISDIRASAEYRLIAVEELVRRVLLTCLEHNHD